MPYIYSQKQHTAVTGKIITSITVETKLNSGSGGGLIVSRNRGCTFS